MGCSVFGAIVSEVTKETIDDLICVFGKSEERGRDSWGLVFDFTQGNHFIPRTCLDSVDFEVFQKDERLWKGPFTAIGNCRAEPTSEYCEIKTKEDIQPFISPSGRYSVAHNGVISNDFQLLEELGIQDLPTCIDSWVIGACLDVYGWVETITNKLIGSFAILVLDKQNPGTILYATNYRPLYIRGNRQGTSFVFASQSEYLRRGSVFHDPSPIELKPYTAGSFDASGLHSSIDLYPEKESQRVLVVCSGGLDSSTVAWKYHKEGYEVELFYLKHEHKAQVSETQAVECLAETMGVEVHFVYTDFFAQFAQSVLTDPTKEVNKSKSGEAGMEFAYEWTPCRNTILFALAAAFAETHNFDIVALGVNLEESGAYPDNEQEFINKWNSLSPYALKPYHKLRFEAPLQSLMKREIVQLAHELKAPVHLMWSCYTSGEKHCGECGPCYMRMKAHQQAGILDQTEYEETILRIPSSSS